MDDVSFKIAPVVELIAELRWLPADMPPPVEGHLTFAVGNDGAEFGMRFSNEVFRAGYSQAERVVPANFPVPLHQVVWRFRKPGDAGSLLQVGAGVFSANALRPYRRWKDFRPTVQLGIAGMLAARPAADKAVPISALSLRYMNAFSDTLLKGHSPQDFLRDVLGLKTELPAGIASRADPALPTSSNSSFLVPLAGTKKTMSVNFGDGMVDGKPAAIYDVTVGETTPIPADEASIMAALDGSRNVIHACFLAMTKPLVDVMQPDGGH